MRLILLGAPGAGKGTQAEILSKRLGIPTISTGNILREAIRNRTETGLKAKAFMDQGNLVPDEVIIGIVRDRLAEPDCANGYILDGMPRTIPQAEALVNAGIEIDCVISIEIDDAVIEQRMTGRRVCGSCGSSYHVGMVSKYNWERLLRRPVEVCLASEFRYCDPLVDDHSLVIFISQSGETADTLAALREANARGARTLAIVNVVGSAISKAAHDVIYTCAGPEIAVATTKAYSTQLAVIYLLAMYIGEKLGTLAPECYAAMLEGLQRLPDQVAQILVPENLAKIEEAAEAFSRNHDVFFIGRNLDSATCLEAYPAGELKHGPISLIEEETLVVALATVEKLFDKTMANVREVKARGAHVLGVTTEDFAGEIEKYVDRSLIVPKTHPLLQPSLTVIPLQAFAYYIALARGCDVDMPRNLAKSVTVE